MYKWIRPLLFRLDPETAHQLTLSLMRFGGVQPVNSLLRRMYAVPEKPAEAFGLKFKNPVGLAAGSWSESDKKPPVWVHSSQKKK